MADKPKSPKKPASKADDADETIEQRLERVTELTDQELADLEAEIREAGEQALEDDQIPIEVASQLAEAVESIRAEVARREEAKTARAAQADEIRQRLAPPAAETPPAADGDGEGAGDEGDGEGAGEGEGDGDEGAGDGDKPAGDQPPTAETPAAPAAPVAPASPAPKSVAASLAMIRERRPASRAPRPPDAVQPNVVIAAGGDVKNFSAGQALTPNQLGEAFAEKFHVASRSSRGKGQAPGRLYVGSIQAKYPEERSLTASAQENGERIGQFLDTTHSMEALTAAGGLCAPLEVSYDLLQMATRGRPVRDALGRFQADRGGLRWVNPPRLADVSGAVSIWTNANDADPGSDGPATKPCLVIDCGDEETATIDAVTLCLTVGNFQRRTFAEQFERFYQLSLAWHDRVAEGMLLDQIGAGSTLVTDGQNLGATRDLLESWGRAAAAYRSRHRMADDAPLTLMAPSWVPDMMQADLAREMPGAPNDRLAFVRSEVNKFLTARNLRISWYMDSETGEGQIFNAQVAGPLQAWPARVTSYMFAPGTWLFLDGGTLDLGVEIRDSVLNASNNVQAFLETFEGTAFTGIESLKLRNDVCVSGEAAELATAPCGS